jgi:hypothetical protein
MTLPHKEFHMSEEQFEVLVNSIVSEPLIMLQCGMPESPQEKANRAWNKLGREMGFVGNTARPIYGKDQTWFTAEPVEPEVLQ